MTGFFFFNFNAMPNVSGSEMENSNSNVKNINTSERLLKRQEL